MIILRIIVSEWTTLVVARSSCGPSCLAGRGPLSIYLLLFVPLIGVRWAVSLGTR